MQKSICSNNYLKPVHLQYRNRTNALSATPLNCALQNATFAKPFVYQQHHQHVNARPRRVLRPSCAQSVQSSRGAVTHADVLDHPKMPKSAILSLDSATSQVIHGSTQGSALPEPPLGRKGSFRLNPMDQFFSNMGTTVFAYVYKEGFDMEHAKAALNNVLALYPVLAGQAAPTRDGAHLDLHWDLDVRGLELLAATSPCTAHQLLPAGPHASQDGTRLLPVGFADMGVLDSGLPPPPMQLNGGALARAMVVQLAPTQPGGKGGAVVALAASHMIMDAGSMRQVLYAWAAQTRVLSGAQDAAVATKAVMVPQFTGHWEDMMRQAKEAGMVPGPGATLQHPVLGILPPPPAAAAPPSAAPSQPFAVTAITPVDTSTMVGSRGLTPITPFPPIFGPAVMFFFDHKHIAALKAQANLVLPSFSDFEGSVDSDEPITFVSSNDVVSARMWQIFSHLPSNTSGKPTKFVRATDLRPRLMAAAGGDDKATKRFPIGSCAHLAWSSSMPARDKPLGYLAAELRRMSSGRTSKEQGLSAVVFYDWAEKQGLLRRVAFTGTAVFGGDNSRKDVDTASTTWDFNAPDLDFGTGAPVWFQWNKPEMIMNHIVIKTGFSANPASDDGKGVSKGKSEQGMWVLAAMPPPDMIQLLEEGVEVIKVGPSCNPGADNGKGFKVENDPGLRVIAALPPKA